MQPQKITTTVLMTPRRSTAEELCELQAIVKLVSMFTNDWKVRPEHHLKSFEIGMATAGVTSSTDFVRAFKLTLQGEATNFVDDVELEELTE